MGWSKGHLCNQMGYYFAKQGAWTVLSFVYSIGVELAWFTPLPPGPCLYQLAFAVATPSAPSCQIPVVYKSKHLFPAHTMGGLLVSSS